MSVRADPDALLEVYNTCLKGGVFPKVWKTARLVLIYKGGRKAVTAPNSFRLLCMLSNLAKLLERFLLRRLSRAIIANGDYAENQFGLSRRGTIQALQMVIGLVESAASGARRNKRLCLMITLDVHNAFNSAP